MSNNCSVHSWLDGVEDAVTADSTSNCSLALGQELETVDSGSIASSAASAPSIAQTSVKTTLADLQRGEWPTHIYNLNGKEAKAAGGVLSRYARLLEISRGIRVIPHHLKVSLPIDDSKLSKCLLLASRRTSSKRKHMLMTSHMIWLTDRQTISWRRSNKHISRVGAIEQIISS